MVPIIIVSLFIALLGLYLYSTKSKNPVLEGFTSQPRCPDMLIQNGAKLYLYNSKLAKIPGVNPIQFDNLEEYTEFLDWQRSQGIRCPVLYLQKTVDAQGKTVYKVRPDVAEPQGGLNPTQTASNPTNQAQLGVEYDPAFMDDYLNQDSTLLVDATRNNPPFNQNSYPSFDESAYYDGYVTPLDKMDEKYTKKGAISPIATHASWGGAAYTQRLVDQGYFAANEVSIYVP
jgi:hypothetical protein